MLPANSRVLLLSYLGMVGIAVQRQASANSTFGGSGSLLNAAFSYAAYLETMPS
jgi:hypothetical protein